MRWIAASVGMLLVGWFALAQPQGAPAPPAHPTEHGDEKGEPLHMPRRATPDDVAQPPSSDAFNQALASAGEGGTQPGASYAPGFFGDLLGGVTTQPLYARGEGAVASIPDVALASAIKISDSDSPRPVDRVYYLYNFFGNIDSGYPFLADMQLHRHTIGFEKTLLRGNASIGLRMPFFTLGGDPTYESAFAGDLSIITKLALINNPTTGNVASVGFAVATPTGGTPSLLGFNDQRFAAARISAAFLQVYGGYVYNVRPRLYVHGFHAILVPTDSQLPTFMTNDIGAGLWLLRDPAGELIRGILPTVELHVNTPFNQRGPVGPPFGTGRVSMQDTVNLTTGCYILFPRSILGGGISVPLANGPHTIEALASYTLRF